MEKISNQDIRWKQRFQNYEKAFKRLARAIEVVKVTPDGDLLQSGFVQTNGYTFELAWKTLKDYLMLEGFEVHSPREAIRRGFQSGYITNGEDWLQALADRNLTTHIYDDEIIARVLNEINGNRIRSVFPHFPEVQEAVLFGSRAKGNYRQGSDIDIAVKGRYLKIFCQRFLLLSMKRHCLIL